MCENKNIVICLMISGIKWKMAEVVDVKLN